MSTLALMFNVSAAHAQLQPQSWGSLSADTDANAQTPETAPPAAEPAAPAAPPPAAPPAATASSSGTLGSALEPAAPEATEATETAPIVNEAPVAEDASAADGGNNEFGSVEDMRARSQLSWLGPVGGLHLVDATSGLPLSVRLQLGFEYYRGSDYLFTGDTNENLGGTLGLSVSPIDHLEISAALSNHVNSNSEGSPVLLQVVGDALIDAKGYAEVLPWLSLGGDLRIALLNTVGDLGLVGGATSFGLRGDATVDLRRIEKPLPLLFRGNLDYYFDNSGALIGAVEDARYAALSPSTRRAKANEDRQLVTRVERLALGINRVDMMTFGLGAEAPLRAGTDFWIQPLVEWRLGVPVNRQGYNCLAVRTNAGVGQPDGCLALQKLAAAPSTLSLGVRALTPWAGLSALLGFDIGLSGTSTFVRELAPNRPWALYLSVAFAPEVRKPAPEIRTIAAPPTAAAAPIVKPHVVGVVVAQGENVAIAGATVRYPGLDFNSQLTGDDGRFSSYDLEPGEVTFEISHPSYETRSCAATIIAPVAAGAAGSTVVPDSSGLMPPAADGGGAAAGWHPAQAPLIIPLRCELTPKPHSSALHGSVTGDHGGLAGISIDITGPTARNVTSDAQGNFTLEGLPPGEYSARVDANGYLFKQQSFSVTASGDSSLSLALSAKPTDSQVTMTAKEVKIHKQIMFKSNSAEIDESSNALLGEIADVLMRNPQAKQIEVQGHTDNRGDPAQNLQLSQSRAEAVVSWLVNAGVGSDRLQAKGYGDSRPLVPNLTPGNRARNRRVQFMLKDQ